MSKKVTFIQIEDINKIDCLKLYININVTSINEIFELIVENSGLIEATKIRGFRIPKYLAFVIYKYVRFEDITIENLLEDKKEKNKKAIYSNYEQELKYDEYIIKKAQDFMNAKYIGVTYPKWESLKNDEKQSKELKGCFKVVYAQMFEFL